MGKENNLTDFLTDVADAIREKKGTTDKINPQNFSDEIKGIKTSMWTGRADVEGLKAIGWDDEDIAFYQEHGVNWNEEDDELYKVSDDNKALYGVLTWSNISQYKDRIVWLPKISEPLWSSSALFSECRKMKGVPMFDMSEATSMASMFINCTFLSCIPKLDVGKVRNINACFQGCNSISYIELVFESITNSMRTAFNGCYALKRMPKIKNNDGVTNFYGMCSNCFCLTEFAELDFKSATNVSSLFANCNNLNIVKIKNISISISLQWQSQISKNSMLYIINNEAATEVITITLCADAYARLATDPDIVEALSNHPLVSLASA